MDGLLVIDKPVGPTSHDVVARVRRAIGERRIGHTGTLDPGASGVLPLVVGRATRLARFLSAGDKSYTATVRLGIETDTYDGAGAPVGAPHAGSPPTQEQIARALDRFRGTFPQQPPRYSAKKVGGRRSYEMARSSEGPRSLDLVQVTVHRLELTGMAGACVTVELDCSAGFYVRSLAHDLGQSLGVGAHLAALRRTRSGDVTLADAASLEAVEQRGRAFAEALVPLERMLPRMPVLRLTPEGVLRTRHGRDLGPADFTDPVPAAAAGDPGEAAGVRLFDIQGQLLALARPAGTPGLLHPFVVLV